MRLFYDWQILMEAVRVWMSGGDPYGPYRHPLGDVLHSGSFAYPPPTLLLGIPLALLPMLLSGLIFTLVSVVAFERWARVESGQTGLPWLVLWLPLAQGLWIGQTTLLAVAGLALAEQAYRGKRDRLAAMLLALALLKPQTVVLPAAWLLICALRERRWRMLGFFAAIVLALWGGAALVAGPQIYRLWLGGLDSYDQFLPNRPLLFPPFGPLLGLLAVLLWRRHGRGDIFGLTLLLNTLIYPLSVIYVAVAVAFVVIRWRPRPAWYALAASWAVPMIWPLAVRTPETIAALTQAIIGTGLLAGLLPPLLPALRRRLAPAGRPAGEAGGHEG